MTMDFQSAMETFAEAWVAANSKPSPLAELATQSQALALTRNTKSPLPVSTPAVTGGSSRESLESTVTPAAERAGTPLDSAISPPSVKEEFEGTGKTLGKSLPVHCIVEAICSLDENRTIQQSTWRRRTLVETDSYVIISVSTLFHELVQAALLQLGYSPECAAGARGSVVIKNWKPLSFNRISDDPLATVGDILGDLSSVATLRIQVFRGRPGAMMDIKDKLLRFLLVQSHGLLMSAGCPLDEVLLSNVCRSGTGMNIPEMSEDTRKKFDQWWAEQLSTQSSNRPHLGIPCQFPSSSHPSKILERPVPESGHPALQTVHGQFPNQKTRMRTSFDPELELPKLQRWFADNQHPSRQQIQQYVKELNSLQSRRGRKPLDVNNVVYWFKNARAAQKRAEIRNIGPGLPCHLVNGYNNYSPTNGSSFLMSDGYLCSERLDHRMKNNYRGRGPNTSQISDEFSNTGSDLDEEDANGSPQSPARPLSLTTRKDESRDGTPRCSTPAQEPQRERKIEIKDDEPINYHSSSDHSNNNKIHHGLESADAEAEDTEPESKSNFEMVSHMIRPISEHNCTSPDIDSPLLHRPPNEGLERLAASFPLVPNSMFSHSIMYMSQYIPGLSHPATSPPGSSALAMSALSADERRKRNRTFIDPVTEVPRLEQWFSLNTHPSHNLILKYTEELNCMAYRQKFPRLEPKNVQFWFKNRRAKCKRLKMSLFDSQTSTHFQGEKE